MKDDFLQAFKACAETKVPEIQSSAAKSAETQFAFKAAAFNDEEGIIIGKLSVAGNFDREKERVTLPALKAATYELVRNIGRFDEADEFGVDINHEQEAIKCDVLMAWIGDPMPDPNATYVALRPHDREVYEATKAGEIVGMSWSGPYLLREAA